ncbi:hypothetical protein [Nitrososphaeria virus YSH_174770]|uniref:Uncharacterized protein n=1 Tax=Nitrososphaeria virus YSH_174770 TaxID=3071322 RepID=A0A976YDX2_9CAUD|nr:hypothetical protein QKV93_gp33 [Yangshan Harbor Nitrososphaeria virus]UVF62378.1 hypothetical protein [Nitrososphaeria virus YSH_174770]
MEKSTFHETKEVVTRLREPFKIKAVPYATTKVRGHQIQVEMNLSWEEIDKMREKDSPVEHMIKNMIEIIEIDLQSEYLGKIVIENPTS